MQLEINNSRLLDCDQSNKQKMGGECREDREESWYFGERRFLPEEQVRADSSRILRDYNQGTLLHVMWTKQTFVQAALLIQLKTLTIKPRYHSYEEEEIVS